MRYIWYILFIFLTIYIIKKLLVKYKVKKAGNKGEKITYKLIKNIVKDYEVKLYKNLKIPLYDDFTEIDVLIVSSKGIICVENKHLSGIITGNKNTKYWTQKKHNKCKKVYNPIMQNNGHIKCLTHHFKKSKLSSVDITSYVVFSNENITLNIKENNVGKTKDFEKFLNNYFSTKPNKYNKNRIIDILNRIS